MTLPAISIIMAVYNGEEYLEETIRSVLGQTFEDFEFVIVDDCSTDSTLEIVKSFPDPRIRVFTNEQNLGQASSLNVGIEKARGKYLARIDADDVYLPEKLGTQIAYMKSHPDVAVLGTGAAILNNKGKVIGILEAHLEPWEIEFRMFYETPMIHVSVLMKRDTILSFGGYVPEYTIAADYHLWARLIMAGEKLANIPDILMAYRIMETTHSIVVGKVSLRDELPRITREYLKKQINCIITDEQAVNIDRFVRAPEVMDRRVFKDTRTLFLQIADEYARIRDIDPGLPRSIVKGLFLRRRLLRYMKRSRIMRQATQVFRTLGKKIERKIGSFRARKKEVTVS